MPLRINIIMTHSKRKLLHGNSIRSRKLNMNHNIALVSCTRPSYPCKDAGRKGLVKAAYISELFHSFVEPASMHETGQYRLHGSLKIEHAIIHSLLYLIYSYAGIGYIFDVHT